MNQLFPKIGICQNCKEKEVPLEIIEINGEKKEWCEDCIRGYLEEDEIIRTKNNERNNNG